MLTFRKPDLWSRLSGLAHELGPGTAFLYLCDRLLRRIHPGCRLHYYHFLAQPIASEPRLSPARGKAFSFRLLSAVDPLLSSLDRPMTVMRDRFAQGAHCLLAIKQEALAGCIWFVRGQYAEDEVRVDYLLPRRGDCVWDFDVYVAEAHRLGYLFARQWDAFDALLKPQGLHYTVSRINAFNQRSGASHRRLGAQECGRALFICVGSMQAMVSDRHPYVALGGRPSLHVGPTAVTPA